MALFRLDDDSDASLNDREQHEDHEEDNGSLHARISGRIFKFKIKYFFKSFWLP